MFRKCGYGDGTIEGASAIAVTTESESNSSGLHNIIRIGINEIQGLGNKGIYLSATSNGYMGRIPSIIVSQLSISSTLVIF